MLTEIDNEDDSLPGFLDDPESDDDWIPWYETWLRFEDNLDDPAIQRQVVWIRRFHEDAHFTTHHVQYTQYTLSVHLALL